MHIKIVMDGCGQWPSLMNILLCFAVFQNVAINAKINFEFRQINLVNFDQSTFQWWCDVGSNDTNSVFLSNVFDYYINI